MSDLAFVAVGVDHAHVYNMTRGLLAEGCRLQGYYQDTDGPAGAYAQLFSEARRFESAEAALESREVALVLVAGVPSTRASVSLDAMLRGKDVLSDKPCVTSLQQLAKLRDAAHNTRTRFFGLFSEHLVQRATLKAIALARSGMIGEVVHTTGFGPHQERSGRPEWFYDRRLSGGILADLATHQISQFLAASGCETAEVVSSRVANVTHPQFPEYEDFGELSLRSGATTGYARVDWLTADGLGTWGDGRFFILGTDGFIEVRKNLDIAGRPGGDHLIVSDHTGVRYIDCASDKVDFFARVKRDVLDRSETAVSNDHSFTVTEIALAAQVLAQERGQDAHAS